MSMVSSRVTFSVAGLLFLCCFSTLGHTRPPSNLGFVDLQRVMRSIPAGQLAMAKLRQDKKRIHERLDRSQRELNRMKDHLAKQASLLKDSVKRQRFRELQQRQMDLQENYEQMHAKHKKRTATLLNPIRASIKKTIGAIAREEGFVMILEMNESGLIYAQPTLDITEQVIQRYTQTAPPTATTRSMPANKVNSPSDMMQVLINSDFDQQLLVLVHPKLGLHVYEHGFGGGEIKAGKRARHLCSAKLKRQGPNRIRNSLITQIDGRDGLDVSCGKNDCSETQLHTEYMWHFREYQGQLYLWAVSQQDAMLASEKQQRIQKARFDSFRQQAFNSSCL